MNPATSARPGSALAGETTAWSPSTGAGQPLPATQLYDQPSVNYADKLAQAQAVLQEAALDFATPDGQVLVTQASSLGAEDVVITHLINALGLHIPVFVLETGALHPETLALLDRTLQNSAAPVTAYRPREEAVVQFVAREGAEAMYKSMDLRKACCAIRKLEPLERALAGHQAWITGLRREQSNARAEVPLVDHSEVSAKGEKGRIKLNPLANWTWGDVWHYITTHGVDYNPLHDRFFPSIGCAPCTRAISLGEDFRSGRWWWEQATAKECGLHVSDPAAQTSTEQKATP